MTLSKKILAIGASNSKRSINKQFASWAASQVAGAEVIVADLNDYEMPIYSPDRQSDNGIPQQAEEFRQLITDTDGIVLSLAEYNGSYSAAFKNIYDWISRIDRNVWMNKPMMLLSTAPGGRGGKTILGLALESYSRRNPNLVGGFSLPSFRVNFDTVSGITDHELDYEFRALLNDFTAILVKPNA